MQLEGLQEADMFGIGPALPGLGDRVGFPHLGEKRRSQVRKEGGEKEKENGKVRWTTVAGWGDAGARAIAGGMGGGRPGPGKARAWAGKGEEREGGPWHKKKREKGKKRPQELTTGRRGSLSKNLQPPTPSRHRAPRRWAPTDL